MSKVADLKVKAVTASARRGYCLVKMVAGSAGSSSINPPSPDYAEYHFLVPESEAGNYPYGAVRTVVVWSSNDEYRQEYLRSVEAAKTTTGTTAPVPDVSTMHKQARDTTPRHVTVTEQELARAIKTALGHSQGRPLTDWDISMVLGEVRKAGYDTDLLLCQLLLWPTGGATTVPDVRGSMQAQNVTEGDLTAKREVWSPHGSPSLKAPEAWE